MSQDNNKFKNQNNKPSDVNQKSKSDSNNPADPEYKKNQPWAKESK